jgi:hypothetical protein
MSSLRTACCAIVVALATALLAPHPTAAAEGATPATRVATAAVDETARPTADRRPPNARPGRYKGHFYTHENQRRESFTFRISKNGRVLTDFRATIGVICSYYPPDVESHPLRYPEVQVKRNHRFKRVWKPNQDSRIVLQGRFKGKRLVSGRLDYTVGVCVRTADLRAKRIGK